MRRLGTLRRIPLAWAIAAMVLATHRPLEAKELDIEVPILVLEQEQAVEEDGDQETDLTQMVVSAAKHIETVQENSSIISIVTRDEIVEHGYLDLADLLDTIPGFEGNRPSFTLTTTEAFARGNPRTILYLWNGVPLNSPQNNRRALGPYLPIDAIDRVEVVSGPGGVLWGADAYLGIVSISTQGPGGGNEAYSQAKVAMGMDPRSQGEYRASATVDESFLDGRIGLHGTIGLVTSRGPLVTPPYDIIAGPGPAPEPDGTLTLTPTLGVTHNKRDLWVPLTLGLEVGPLRLDLLYPLVARQFHEFNDRDLRTDRFASGAQVITGESSTRAEIVTLASLTYAKDLTRQSHVTGRAYFTGFEDRWVQQIMEPRGLLGNELIIGADRYVGMSSFLHDGAYRYGLGIDLAHDGRRSRLVFGAELYVEGIRALLGSLEGGLMSGGEFVRARAGRRLVTASFVEDEVKLTPHVVVKLGGRAQYAPSSYAPLVLGSAALRVEVATGINFKANVSQGFRPPGFEDTNGNDDPLTNPYTHRQSNPDLKPERSLSAETELSGLTGYASGPLRRLATRIGYQYTRLDDLIVLDSTGVPQNTNRRVVHSAEARADALFRGGHRAVAGYTFLVGEDMETGPMRNVPQHRLSLAFDARMASHFHGFVGLTASGGAEDLNRRTAVGSESSIASPADVTVDHLPASAIVNLGLRAPDLMDGHMDVAVDVWNVFAERHFIADPNFDSREAIYSIPSLGRSVMVSLSWRM